MICPSMPVSVSTELTAVYIHPVVLLVRFFSLEFSLAVTIDLWILNIENGRSI